MSSAQFEVPRAFVLRHRGTVIAGAILSGTIRVGMRIMLPTVAVPVRAVEFLDHSVSEARADVALIVDAEVTVADVPVGSVCDVTET